MKSEDFQKFHAHVCNPFEDGQKWLSIRVTLTKRNNEFQTKQTIFVGCGVYYNRLRTTYDKVEEIKQNTFTA